MGDVYRGRTRAVFALLVLAPAAAVLTACEPGGDPGYARVTHRAEPVVPRAPFPDPPPVVAGTQVGAPAAALVPVDLPEGLAWERVEEGQQLYGTVCIGCHGPAGVGSAAGPALNDQNWIGIGGTFPDLVNVITRGVPQPRQFPAPMPAGGGGNFTDEQVRSLAAYVYALSRQEGA